MDFAKTYGCLATELNGEPIMLQYPIQEQLYHLEPTLFRPVCPNCYVMLGVAVFTPEDLKEILALPENERQAAWKAKAAEIDKMFKDGKVSFADDNGLVCTCCDAGLCPKCGGPTVEVDEKRGCRKCNILIGPPLDHDDPRVQKHIKQLNGE